MIYLILVVLQIIVVFANNESGNTILFKCKDSVNLGSTLHIPQSFIDTKKPYTFRLRTRNEEIDCFSDERFYYTVNLNDTSSKPLFTAHGILIVHTESHRIFKKSKDFCLQSIDENSNLTLSICNTPCENGGGTKLCVKKCCSIHKMLGYDATEPDSVSCQFPNQGHSNLNWKPDIYRDVFTKLTEDEHIAIEPNVHNSLQFYECSSLSVVIQTHSTFSGEYNENPNIGRFRLLTNGDIAICGGHGRWVTFKDSTYCIDSLQNFGKDNNSHSGDLSTQVIIRCLDNLTSNWTKHDVNIFYCYSHNYITLI